MWWIWYLNQGRNFGRLGVISADLIERFNLCFGNNNIQYKYYLTSNFLTKMRHNEKSLPNKATLVSKTHLICFQLLACLRALRLEWAFCCTPLVAESIGRLPIGILSCSPEVQYSYWDVLSPMVVPVEPWQGAHALQLSGIFSDYQISRGGCIWVKKKRVLPAGTTVIANCIPSKIDKAANVEV